MASKKVIKKAGPRPPKDESRKLSFRDTYDKEQRGVMGNSFTAWSDKAPKGARRSTKERVQRVISDQNAARIYKADKAKKSGRR